MVMMSFVVGKLRLATHQRCDSKVIMQNLSRWQNNDLPDNRKASDLRAQRAS